MSRLVVHPVLCLTTLLLVSGSAAPSRYNIRNQGLLHFHYDDRLDDYDVKFYLIDLEVSDTAAYIKGSSSLVVEAAKDPLQMIVLDMDNILTVDSITVEGRRVQGTHADNQLKIRLGHAISPGSQIWITVYYRGYGKKGSGFTGLRHEESRGWNTRVTWTMSEPFAAREWFPCKQVLSDKADSVYVFITTREDLKAGSNGLLSATVPLPDNKVRYEWKSRYPVAYYLISFAVARYKDYSFYANIGNKEDSLLIQNFIYDNDIFLEQNKYDIDMTAKFLGLFSRLFGPYPFMKEKYGHCIVPSGGGMEHQTMTTLDDFSFTLVSHELAHMWFGDYVTCATWQDIWINEGLASYAEYIANQYLLTQEDADRWMRNAQRYSKYEDGGSIYVPIQDASGNADRIFDYRLSYKKGAAIVHMIRHELGSDSLFFSILKEFLVRYRHGTATGNDFRQILEENSGKDFRPFFDQWYFGEGFPTLTCTWMHRNDTLYINTLQTTSSSTPLFNLLVDFRVNVNGKDTLITRRQQTNFESWQLYLPGQVRELQIDPGKWLLLDVAGVYETVIDPDGESSITVTPGPSQDEVAVYHHPSGSTYDLYLIDASGRILLSRSSDSDMHLLKTRNLTRGIYVILIREGNNLLTTKFVKN